MAVKQIGPYRVKRVLGRGGMGTVYTGVHEEAVLQSTSHPEEAQVKLEAFIAVYGRLRDEDSAAATCVRAAEIQLTGLHRRFQQRLDITNSQIDWCEQQMANEPEDARRICRGIVTLYQGKPWAVSAVQCAQEALKNGDFSTQPE